MKIGPYTLHPHQVRAVEAARAAFQGGARRVLLQAPCGFGKTLCTSAIMSLALEKNRKSLFLASGRKLITQKSSKLTTCGIPHTVLMSREPFSYGHRCVVSSKDTFAERCIKTDRLVIPQADILLIDEAHLAGGKEWQDIYSEYPDAKMLGVTATPALGNGKPLPGWDAMVSGGTYAELIKGGFLVDAQVFSPFMVDMAGVDVNKQSGEFVLDQMAARYDDKVLVGDFIKSWKKHSENRLTGFFASSVKASINAAEEFNAAGIPAAHMDANTDDYDREEAFAAAREGRIKVLCNFGVLRVGVDLPEMECVQLAVSMNSLNTFLQTVGRGGRICTFPDGREKKDFILIDHGGNVHRHGWPTDDHDWSITDERTVQERDEIRKETEKKPREPLCCPECGAMRESGPKCLNCGFYHKKTGLKVRTVEGELKPLERKKVKEKRKQSDTQKLWMSCVCRSANNNGTFKTAAWLYKQQTGEWPPDNVWPNPPFEKRGFRVRDLYPNMGRRKAKT